MLLGNKSDHRTLVALHRYHQRLYWRALFGSTTWKQIRRPSAALLNWYLKNQNQQSIHSFDHSSIKSGQLKPHSPLSRTPMLFQRTLLSCLLAGEITARTLQETLLEDTLIARTAAAEKPSNLVEPPQKALPTATYGLQARAEAIPAPTQSGIANNCEYAWPSVHSGRRTKFWAHTVLGDNYYKVISGDTCIGIAYQHSIALSQFYSWNPAVGSNCQVLLAGYYVCVGVSGMSLSWFQSINRESQNSSLK